MKNVILLKRTEKQSPLLKFISFSDLKRQMIVDAICFLFILLFVYAAFSKLADYEKFRVQLGQSPILTGFAKWVAWFIPAIETMISVMLAFPKWRLYGLYAAFSLMVMFTAYIVAITKFSEYIPCSCGGILQNMSWNQHLVFNVSFIFLAAIAVILNSRKKG